MEILVAQILTFLAVLILVLGINSAFQGRNQKTARISDNWFFNTFLSEIRLFGSTLEPKLDETFPTKRKMIQNDLYGSGLYEKVTPGDIYGFQALMTIIFFISSLVIVFLMITDITKSFGISIFSGLTGWMFPTMWLSRKARERREKMLKEIPYAIDLLTVAMEAGQDFGAAIRYMLSESNQGPLLKEFAVMMHETELGKTRIAALRDLAERINIEDIHAIVTAVIQSIETGGSVVTTLKMQAEDIRRKRFHRAEEKAAKTPSLMLIPTALFILPSVFVIIGTPIFIRLRNAM